MADIDNHKVSLREYIEARMNALEKQVDAQFDDLQRSIDVAYEVNQRRLEGMNEFRATIEDQATRFATRAEMDAFKDKTASDLDAFKAVLKVELASMCDDIQKLELTEAEMKGKASQNGLLLSYLIAFISIVLGILNYINAAQR